MAADFRQMSDYFRIPASLHLPNLVTVGAVDAAGKDPGFTSCGDTVVLYANGNEVESYVPGGSRRKMSGISIASPNVANLAAKFIALYPSPTPVQVIELIKPPNQRMAVCT